MKTYRFALDEAVYKKYIYIGICTRKYRMLSDSDPGCEPNVYIQNRYETMKYVHVYTTFTKKRDHFCALYKKKSFFPSLFIYLFLRILGCGISNIAATFSSDVHKGIQPRPYFQTCSLEAK